MHNTLKWEQVLHEAGHRVTRQRTVILDAVCTGQGHTTLGEIYARALRKDPTLDRSTVYRALKLFIDVDLVVAADTGEGETLYEIKRPDQHHHLVCRACGREQEIGDDALRGMFDEVRRVYRFKVATDHIVLFGLCDECQSRESR